MFNAHQIADAQLQPRGQGRGDRQLAGREPCSQLFRRSFGRQQRHFDRVLEIAGHQHDVFVLHPARDNANRIHRADPLDALQSSAKKSLSSMPNVAARSATTGRRNKSPDKLRSYQFCTSSTVFISVCPMPISVDRTMTMTAIVSVARGWFRKSCR